MSESADPDHSATPAAAVRAARGTRSAWNRLRRRWKAFSVGGPEDALLQSDAWLEGGRTLLHVAVATLLVAPPLLGLLLGKWTPHARLTIALAVATGVLFATQLASDRTSRGALLLPAMLGLALAAAVGLLLSGTGALALDSELGAGLGWALPPLVTLASGLREDPRLPASTGFFCAIALALVALSEEHSTGLLALSLLAIALAAGAGMWLAAQARRERVRALRDQVTGLLDASSFRRMLAREIARAQHSAGDLTLGRLRLAALAADAAARAQDAPEGLLRSVADLLRERCRATDAVAYLGAGDFAIAFLDSAHPRLVERLASLRGVVEAIDPAARGPVGALHVRTALASLHRDGIDADTLFSVSSRRLN